MRNKYQIIVTQPFSKVLLCVTHKKLSKIQLIAFVFFLSLQCLYFDQIIATKYKHCKLGNETNEKSCVVRSFCELRTLKTFHFRMAALKNTEQEPDIADNKQDIPLNDSNSNSNPNAFLNPLKRLFDTRAITLLINILSKIIQDPTDKRKQLSYFVHNLLFHSTEYQYSQTKIT